MAEGGIGIGTGGGRPLMPAKHVIDGNRTRQPILSSRPHVSLDVKEGTTVGSETPVEIFVAVYPDQATAKQMIKSLQEAQKAGVIELIDAAQVSKNDKGQIHTDELRELTVKKGAVGGAVVGAVLGVIFPPTLLAGALVGGAAGGLIGKLRDSGIKTKDLESLATDLQPGEVAVLAIVEDKWVDQLTAAIQGYERMSRRRARCQRRGRDHGRSCVRCGGRECL